VLDVDPTMLSNIIQRNNTAVQSLKEGRCSDASVALKLALLHLQAAFRSASIDEASMVGFSKENDVCHHVQETDLLDTNVTDAGLAPQAAHLDLDANMNIDASDAYLVLFDRAFYLPPHESRERVISTVLLYNCALASHISGVLRGNSQSVYDALRMYKFACRILLEIADVDDANSTELLRLALYNNMGHVSFQLCQLADADYYVKCLRQEMGVTDDDILGAALPTISDDDYDFFCANVTIRVELMGAPAA
jgi:hypothetical protein